VEGKEETNSFFLGEAARFLVFALTTELPPRLFKLGLLATEDFVPNAERPSVGLICVMLISSKVISTNLCPTEGCLMINSGLTALVFVFAVSTATL
jgi:hypothetical protein